MGNVVGMSDHKVLSFYNSTFIYPKFIMFYFLIVLALVATVLYVIYDLMAYEPLGSEVEFIPEIIKHLPEVVKISREPRTYRATKCNNEFNTSSIWQCCLYFGGWCGIPYFRNSITRKGSFWGVVIMGEVSIFRPVKIEELRKKIREDQLKLSCIHSARGTESSLGNLLTRRMIIQELQLEDIEYIFRVYFKETELLSEDKQNPISYSVHIVFYDRIQRLRMKLIESILEDGKAMLLYTDGGQNSNEPDPITSDELSF